MGAQGYLPPLGSPVPRGAKIFPEEAGPPPWLRLTDFSLENLSLENLSYYWQNYHDGLLLLLIM
jgi:hypothetical protein